MTYSTHNANTSPLALVSVEGVHGLCLLNLPVARLQAAARSAQHFPLAAAERPGAGPGQYAAAPRQYS